MSEVVKLQLKCNGIGRNEENQQSLLFYFNRRVTDEEMRFLHAVMRRACYQVEQ